MLPLQRGELNRFLSTDDSLVVKIKLVFHIVQSCLFSELKRNIVYYNSRFLKWAQIMKLKIFHTQWINVTNGGGFFLLVTTQINFLCNGLIRIRGG